MKTLQMFEERVRNSYPNVVLRKEYSWKFYSEGKLVAEWTKEKCWLDELQPAVEERGES